MKVLHVPYTFLPDPIGGTEVYVADLMTELLALGVDSSVAAPVAAGTSRAPASGPRTSYRSGGFHVDRLPVTPGPHPVEYVYGAGDPATQMALVEIVRRDCPDIVHFHSYSPAVGGAVAQAVRACGPRVVVTYHTPTVTCTRGSLLRFGHIPCDGRMLVRRCSACVLQAHGIPRPAADFVASIPAPVGEVFRSRERRGRIWTALQMPALMRMRHADSRAYLDAAHVVVAVTAWVRDLLLLNGIDARKIAFSRQGISASRLPAALTRVAGPTGTRPLRAIMLGRLDPTKGFDLPIDALVRNPRLDLTIDLYGDSDTDSQYVRTLRAKVATDPRVTLHPPIPARDVVTRVAEFDVLLVPSQWLESGPLVVLEAQAAGVPIVGTALGGIAERVRHGVDGLLVEPLSIDAWERALQRIVTNPAVLAQWRAQIQPPRTMRAAAEDMANVYRSVLAGAAL